MNEKNLTEIADKSQKIAQQKINILNNSNKKNLIKKKLSNALRQNLLRRKPNSSPK
jgi:hypothetical protein